MGKLSVDIIEDTYLKKSAAADNNLSILIGVDRFAYLISSADHQVLALRVYEQENSSKPSAAGQSTSMSSFLDDVCKSDQKLNQTFARTRIGWNNRLASIVPRRLYDAANKAAYLQYLSSDKGHRDYFDDALPKFGAHQVYAIPADWAAWRNRRFPNSQPLHISSALLNGFSAHAAATLQDGRSLFVHVGMGEVRIALLDANSLYFSNAYTYQAAKDFLYYVLAVFNEFDLDQETTPIWLSGQLVEDSEIYRLLFRYFRKLAFMPCPPALSTGTQLSATPQHFYTDLYFLALP